MSMGDVVTAFPAFLTRKRGEALPSRVIEVRATEVKMLPDLEDLARSVERTRDELNRAKEAHAEAVQAFRAEMEKRALPCLKS